MAIRARQSRLGAATSRAKRRPSQVPVFSGVWNRAMNIRHRQGRRLGAMSDQVTDVTDVERVDRARSARCAARSRSCRSVSSSSTCSRTRTAWSSCPTAAASCAQLERLIDRVSRYDENAAMLFVDLDGLKLINDTFGHHAGDQALIQVARLARQRACARATWSRGSAATSSRSCSAMPTKTRRARPRARLVDLIADCDVRA